MNSELEKKQKAALKICQTLAKAGYRALFAGGCVRDLLLGLPPKDFDIATNATPNEVAKLFPKVIRVGEEFGVQKVILPEGIFEVTTFRQDGPYLDGRHPTFVHYSDEMTDAQRRDFTINAMFMEPFTHNIIDYVGGQEDLKNRLIRTVGEPEDRFQEDYLRLLRAVRFAVRFGYFIEDKTYQAIKKYAPMVTTVSPERIRDELTKILTEGHAKEGIELLDDTGLLAYILPEVVAMKGVEQPVEFHPEGDVFTHTLLMLGFLSNPTPALAYATLFHDIGKPLTITKTDRIRFNNHDKIGALLADEICLRLKMSKKDRERIVWLVKNHMRLAKAPGMRKNRLQRFVREEGFRELLELGKLDCLASHKSLEHIIWLENYLNKQQDETLRPSPLLTGDDLIALGYKPGPLFKQILTALEDAQLEGKIKTKNEALTFVTNNWPPSFHPPSTKA